MCWNIKANFADPLQYRRGPPGDRGPPVENPCFKANYVFSVFLHFVIWPEVVKRLYSFVHRLILHMDLQLIYILGHLIRAMISRIKLQLRVKLWNHMKIYGNQVIIITKIVKHKSISKKKHVFARVAFPLDPEQISSWNYVTPLVRCYQISATTFSPPP